MISDFLIINCIGKDDKLALRINKDFFIHNFERKENNFDQLVPLMLNFLNAHNVKLDQNFSVIVNMGPGSFSGIRVALAVAKGIGVSKKVRLYGYNDIDLKVFDQQNIERLFNENLIEKKLIKPIYLS